MFVQSARQIAFGSSRSWKQVLERAWSAKFCTTLHAGEHRFMKPDEVTQEAGRDAI